jgi:hypothetical protein
MFYSRLFEVKRRLHRKEGNEFFIVDEVSILVAVLC